MDRVIIFSTSAVSYKLQLSYPTEALHPLMVDLVGPSLSMHFLFTLLS